MNGTAGAVKLKVKSRTESTKARRRVSRADQSKRSWDYIECPQFPGKQVLRKVNTGSHSTCAFNLWHFISVFVDGLLRGEKKKESEGKR